MEITNDTDHPVVYSVNDGSHPVGPFRRLLRKLGRIFLLSRGCGKKLKKKEKHKPKCATQAKNHLRVVVEDPNKPATLVELNIPPHERRRVYWDSTQGDYALEPY